MSSNTTDAERQLVLKANAMLTLADSVEDRTLAMGQFPTLQLSQNEWQLIAYALRHTADSDN